MTIPFVPIQPGPFGKAMRNRNHEWVAGFLSARFGVVVTAGFVGKESEVLRLGMVSCWSDGTWVMWWKLRLAEYGSFPVGREDAPVINLPVTLHTGFLFIPETAAHWECLRRPDPDDPPRHAGPATPGIARTNNRPTPVDRTAARVVGLHN